MTPEYARRYRTLHDGHWWWRSREALVLAEVGRLHRKTPRRRILDVGCGDGLLFGPLGAFGEVEGLEPDASLVQDSRWRSRIMVRPLSVDFRPSRPFDLVLMLDVLEHIADDASALRAVHGALRPGGHLLLTVPALNALWSRHDEANAHHRRYERADLTRALEAAGFVVETLRFAFAWAVAPLLARRLLSPAKGPTEGTGNYAVSIPPRPINQGLQALSRVDHAVGRHLRWPIGSSLLAVARRSEAA